MWSFELLSLCGLIDHWFTKVMGQRAQGQPIQMLVEVLRTFLVPTKPCNQMFPTCRVNFAPRWSPTLAAHSNHLRKENHWPLTQSPALIPPQRSAAAS